MPEAGELNFCRDEPGEAFQLLPSTKSNDLVSVIAVDNRGGMTAQISVGLIGYGMAGRTFHAPVIQAVPSLRLKKVVERRTDEARKRYPWVEVVPDAAALLQDEEISLVVIATPNVSHFDLARQSLEANKHVVVEKPFTTTSGQA